MSVPTILVRRKQTGDQCLINQSDFDPQLHVDVADLPAAEEKVEAPAQPAARVKKSS